MAAPSANSPIPPTARPIVERVHRRYRGQAIDDPRNLSLTATERYELARSGYYPIPPDVIRLGMTPAEYQRQQILDAVDERLAEQLPDAVMAVLETMEI